MSPEDLPSSCLISKTRRNKRVFPSFMFTNVQYLDWHSGISFCDDKYALPEHALQDAARLQALFWFWDSSCKDWIQRYTSIIVVLCLSPKRNLGETKDFSWIKVAFLGSNSTLSCTSGCRYNIPKGHGSHRCVKRSQKNTLRHLLFRQFSKHTH